MIGRSAFAAAAAALLLTAAGPALAAVSGPALGDPAPDFSLTTLDGRHLSLGALRGKTVVLNVFGSWCPPCRLETPDLIAEATAERAHGVVFLGIDTTETPAVARAFAAAKGIPYPIVATTSDSPFAVAYDIRNYPTTFVIDPHGRLRARHADNILPRAQLHAYVVAAQHDESAPLDTPFQRALDASLDPAHFAFTGDPATVLAGATAAAAAIAQADALEDDAMDDPARDHDLIRTQEEEAKLRDRAIDALSSVDAGGASDAANALLARLHGDQAVALGLWADAQTAYQQALALQPGDVDALAGAAYVAAKLGDDARVVAIDERLVANAPTSSGYVGLARAKARLGDRSGAYAALDAAVPLATTPAALAWTHLYAGRVAVQLGDVVRARTEFAAAATAAAAIPPQRPAYALYVEQAQEATIALATHTAAPLTVDAAPWTGADLPGSIESTVKYRVAVTAVPGTTVTLHATGLPTAWVGSWCTDRVCQPTQTSVVVPSSGVKIVEFQVVPDDPRHAGAHPLVKVTARTRSALTSVTIRG